ncbi:MAG: ATP-binding cassette domain-containing protein, partial [Micrococcaceae bacterium]
MTSSALPAPPDSPAAHAAEAPILRGRGLRVKYDDHVVLDDVDVEIPRGRFTVIVGPNACGKSTLLKTLSRVLK